MISAMRRVTLLFPSREKKKTLNKLQEAALFEAIQTEEVTCEEMEAARIRHEKCRRILEELKAVPVAKKQKILQKRDRTPEELIEEFEHGRSSLLAASREIDRLRIEEAKLAPWGEFDLSYFDNLKQAGVQVLFLETIEEEFERILQQDLAIEPVSKSDGKVYFILFYRKERPRIDAHELRLPELSLAEIREQLEKAQKNRSEIEENFQKGLHYKELLEDYLTSSQDEIEYYRTSLAAAGAFGGDDPLCRLDGWIAAGSEKELVHQLESLNLWHHIEDPREGEEPPILLKNNTLVRPFETITRIFSLPRYNEIDPTPFFAPFFALFFGLCVADIGYGAVVLIASLVLYLYGPRKLKQVFALGSILGLLTIAGGAFLNTIFGATLFTLGEGPVTPGEKIAFLGSYSKEGRIVFPSITFSLFLGFVQVALGIAMQAAGRASRGLVHTLQPLSYLGMMFGAIFMATHENILEMASFTLGDLQVGKTLSQIPGLVGISLFYGSLALLFLFNNPEKKIWIRPLTAVWELYGFSTGLLGDILSYLRLFALGLAGGLLGNAFNNIAFLFVTNENGYTEYTPGGVVAMVLVLVAGHTLNFGLALLGGFVHSLRLTFVEFYRNVKFEGGGKVFTPFRYTPKEGG